MSDSLLVKQQKSVIRMLLRKKYSLAAERDIDAEMDRYETLGSDGMERRIQMRLDELLGEINAPPDIRVPQPQLETVEAVVSQILETS